MNDLHSKLGQLFVVPLARSSLRSAERRILRKIPFGGFVLFKHNCSDPDQLARLCGSFWNLERILPPFIAIDQEGGRADRLPAAFTHFPAPARIGSTRDLVFSYRAARATAIELALAGINLNFAPVLDVNSNPNNPVIGQRSFSSEPREVIAFADAWAQGTRDGGIIPCGKHFPGHGDTDQDSHFELPRVDRDVPTLREIELPPFVDACRHEIEALMTAHVIYTALDPEFPATLSKRILTGLLREELRYDGVVFSDALEMKAISNNYGNEEAAALALEAGVDVLLYCHRLEEVVRVYEYLCRRAAKDTALASRIEQSYARVATLKNRYLKAFTPRSGDAIVKNLVRLDHERIVNQIQASL